MRSGYGGVAVKDDERNADAAIVTTRKRLRSNEIALIGIVLLAFGIAVLAGAPQFGALRVVLAGTMWSGAVATFVVARRAESAL